MVGVSRVGPSKSGCALISLAMACAHGIVYLDQAVLAAVTEECRAKLC